MSLIQWMEDVDFLEATKRLADGGTTADADFADAIEKLLQSLEATEEGEDRSLPKIALPREFIPVDEKHYPRYVEERGFSVARAQRFGLGYCKDGYYANRLIAPVYANQACVGFQARWMRRKPPAGVKKTKHSKGAKLSHWLYNWDNARFSTSLVLVESPWAAIKIGNTGAASFGKTLSQAQLELILQSDTKDLVIMWDRDKKHKPGSGGYDKALALAERLADLLPVRAVKLPDSRGPDEHTTADLRRLIARTPTLSRLDAWADRLRRRVSWLSI